ncbi:MAG: 2-C-methyl-D-erythritol 4-phosphate cytidylyltransferase [Burkholderiaceae bacterium]
MPPPGAAALSPASAPRLYALVPCAGVGTRSGAEVPKQYATIAGHSVIAHTLAALAGVPGIAATLVVLAPDDCAFERQAPGFAGWVARCGGASRAASVANGLAELLVRGADESDWALVHDAARCLVRSDAVTALIEACRDDACGGLLALPLADTLKAARDGRVSATLDRADKWLAQTPQMFRIGALRDALAQSGANVSDEAGAMEAAGHAPLLVPGSVENFKLTWPSDFELAERLLIGRA